MSENGRKLTVTGVEKGFAEGFEGGGADSYQLLDSQSLLPNSENTA